MGSPTRKPTRAERRGRKRIQLSNPLVARIGSYGAMLVDISDGGARIEHYTRLKTGETTILRFEFERRSVRMRCRVVSCRVARFAAGDDGVTVFESGLSFLEEEDTSDVSLLKGITTTFVARALAEQVANAKGVKPLDEEHMPIFRGGVLSSNEFQNITSTQNRHLIPSRKLVTERGFVCYRLGKKTSWVKKWTTDRKQPEDGFTLSVHEPTDQIELLCETYRNGDETTRELIRKMAAMSLEPKDE